MLCISQAEAGEAAEILHDERYGAVLKTGAKVTDPVLCKKIHSNSLLREACHRKGIHYDSPGFLFCAACMGRSILDRLCFAFLLPLSIPLSIYAHMKLADLSAELRPLREVSVDGELPAEKFIRDLDGREIRRRSGVAELKTSTGETNGLGSCYYSPFFHRVTLPTHIAKSSSPMAKAVVSHECGHAEQRKLLLTVFAVSAAALVVALATTICWSFCIFSFPVVMQVVFVAAVLWLAITPFVTFLYEIDASRRGIANLLAYDHVTKSEDAAQAAHVLQLAACTYLSAVACKIFEFALDYLSRSQDNADVSWGRARSHLGLSSLVSRALIIARGVAPHAGGGLG
jgi:Zn-dependent membrane protease YugP